MSAVLIKAPPAVATAALTINPTTGDVKIDLAGVDTNTPDNPGVISPNEIIAIIEGEVTNGNLVSSVEVGPERRWRHHHQPHRW